MTVLKEEKIREIYDGIKEMRDNPDYYRHTQYEWSSYWDGYFNILRRILKIPPDDLNPEEDYE